MYTVPMVGPARWPRPAGWGPARLRLAQEAAPPVSAITTTEAVAATVGAAGLLGYFFMKKSPLTPVFLAVGSAGVGAALYGAVARRA